MAEQHYPQPSYAVQCLTMLQTMESEVAAFGGTKAEPGLVANAGRELQATMRISEESGQFAM